jgi:hypothetical protein
MQSKVITGALVVVLLAGGWLVGRMFSGSDEYGDLDVRTFQLEYIEPDAALRIIDPYVFGDRGGAISTDGQTGAITVRETPEMLSRIEQVLSDYDKPDPSVKLHFRIIEANGGQTDPGLEDITEALPKEVFSFEGFRLVGETVMTGIEWSEVAQRVAAGDRTFYIRGGIGEVRAAGDSGTVKLEVGLHADDGLVFQTGVNARLGQTLILGSAQPNPNSGALILVVQADVVRY